MRTFASFLRLGVTAHGMLQVSIVLALWSGEAQGKELILLLGIPIMGEYFIGNLYHVFNLSAHAPSIKGVHLLAGSNFIYEEHYVAAFMGGCKHIAVVSTWSSRSSCVVVACAINNLVR